MSPLSLSLYSRITQAGFKSSASLLPILCFDLFWIMHGWCMQGSQLVYVYKKE